MLKQGQDTRIELLQKQIGDAKVLLANPPISFEPYQAWVNSTRPAIVRCFGQDSNELKSFAVGTQSSGSMSLAHWEAYFARNIKRQIGHLESCIEVLRAQTQFESKAQPKALKASSKRTTPIDPFKRRYQVFVSSTHDDLVDERRHVMHSLLQTKCIPTGMELFPAASEDKWKLIKRVIDDCDYYVVIVAGRYGSLGPEGKSYTEMEFDYAASSKKSIMGFYHSDLGSIPASKSEQTEIGRQHLQDFVKKVKQINSCASWASAEGLSSAIKSAILNAMEHDPKPGWIRATDVASSDSISSLKQSLGLRNRSSMSESVEKSAETVRFHVHVAYQVSDTPRTRYSYPNGKVVSFEHTFEPTLDEVFFTLAPHLSRKNHRVALKNVLHRKFEKEARNLIPESPEKHIHIRSIDVDRAVFDKCLQTFLARKLLKRVSQPKNVRLKEPYWQLDRIGFQKTAESQSF